MIIPNSAPNKIKPPPAKNEAPSTCPRKIALRSVPTTGCAKKNNDTLAASNSSNDLFHRKNAMAVQPTPTYNTPARTEGVITPMVWVCNSIAATGATMGTPKAVTASVTASAEYVRV